MKDDPFITNTAESQISQESTAGSDQTASATYYHTPWPSDGK